MTRTPFLTLAPEAVPDDPFPPPGERLNAVRPTIDGIYDGLKDALAVGLPDDGQYVFVPDPDPGVSWRSRLAGWAKRNGVTVKQRRMHGHAFGHEGMGYLVRAIPAPPPEPKRPARRRRRRG